MNDLQKPQSRLYLFSFLACGIWLIGLGMYFSFLRPALLPEDLRYMGVSAREIQDLVPGLQRWTRRVFSVMGGFMAASGLLTLEVALHPNAGNSKYLRTLLAIVGVLTVGLMSATNFRLNSDFKWLLLIPALVWFFALSVNSRFRARYAATAVHSRGERDNQ